MEIPSFYLSIIVEIIALVLLFLLGYIIFLTRDKNNLIKYVADLKKKVSLLSTKLKNLTEDNEPIITLLTDTIEHIKTAYQQTFGHDIGKTDTSTKENNSKEHFLYVIGYQNLKATVSALENSNNAERTWDKISAQMSALIENYRIMPETQFETIVEEKAQQDVAQQSKAPKKSVPTKKGSVTLVGRDQFINERKDEIDRLKGKISSQFEEIWELQNNISGKISQSSDPEINNMAEDIQSISRQLKDAELCITMMEADIATSDEEITSLNEQLEQANKKASIIPPSNSELTESIKKKDAIIARFAQESKEMMTLIDGMERNANEQTQRIKELEK
jgi:hypothetical protein